VAQRAIARVLEAVYEQDFLSCSYGFRPGRSAHQALHQLQGVITLRRQCWVLDVDAPTCVKSSTSESRTVLSGE
jgi:retron-type reverse transcriptase